MLKTPGRAPKLSSGCQNQPIAKVAVCRCSDCSGSGSRGHSLAIMRSCWCRPTAARAARPVETGTSHSIFAVGEAPRGFLASRRSRGRRRIRGRESSESSGVFWARSDKQRSFIMSLVASKGPQAGSPRQVACAGADGADGLHILHPQSSVGAALEKSGVYCYICDAVATSSVARKIWMYFPR